MKIKSILFYGILLTTNVDELNENNHKITFNFFSVLLSF